MADKYSNREIFDIIEQEGLGYAVQDYMGAKDCADSEMAKLWTQAKEILDKIEALATAAYDKEGEEK